MEFEPLVLTANTVPRPLVPPYSAVPYSVLPDKTNPACGSYPSLVLNPTRAPKVCRVIKFEPLVLSANTVPVPLVPPYAAVPYRLLPDKINPASGRAPSLLVV